MSELRRILFFDTETTGMYLFDKPAENAKQPYIVQLAALLADSEGNELATMSMLLRPEYPNYEFTISPGAQEIHGITIERCRQYGMPSRVVAHHFLELVHHANVLCCHNYEFDSKVMQTFFHRLAKVDPLPYKQNCCTMQMYTPICKLPSKKPGSFKYPSLTEAYQYCFGDSFDGAHNALEDVRACARIYFEYSRHETREQESVSS